MNGPKHNRENTLDLVMEIHWSVEWSLCRTCRMLLRSLAHRRQFPLVVERLVCTSCQIDRETVRWKLDDSKLHRPQPDDVDQLFSTYDTVLWKVADRLTPSIVVHWKPNSSTQQFDAECHTKRRKCRLFECHISSTTDCHAWVDSTRIQFPLHFNEEE